MTGGLVAVLLMVYSPGNGQISPGDLSEVHAHLEGMSHCTDCHTLGAKVSNEKCLDCHTYLNNRLQNNQGYHASSEVKGKECASCHNEHHGRNFRIINFNQQSFDHDLTGFELLGAHRKEECKNCHKAELISDPKIKSKDFTFLGLGTTCLSCHNDYHRNTLPSKCTDCHDMDAFKPVTKFNHQTTDFPLKGKHQDVDCIKCHKVETIDGVRFQEFADVAFNKCTDCHKDVHENKFGQNCTQCHNEQSFHTVSGMATFDHSKTGFPLVDKHLSVDCKSCHKTKYTDPVRHSRCDDCHKDYHLGQFMVNEVSPDCSSCHDTKGFTMSSYSFERHDRSTFPLTGAHMATPCFVCHKKEDRWTFRNIGIRCADCHKDIHEGYIEPKYYPEKDCKRCHTTDRWSAIDFNHSTTSFSLTGGHSKPGCRDCHFHESAEGKVLQEFKGLSQACASCHKDIHVGQFVQDGVTTCDRCHNPDNWKPLKFDHNKTRFILDGKHKDVACNQCHKPVQKGQITYVQYKLSDIRCEACHH